MGGQDAPELAEDSAALFNRGRSSGAPWAIILQPGAPHQIRAADIEAASRLTMPWISAVVNARVRGGARLEPVTDTDAWLGDHETGAILRARDAEPSQRPRSWLPDERTAAAWRSLVATPK